MNDPKKVCDTWAGAIRAGIRRDLSISPDGKLSPEQVQLYRGIVQVDIKLHRGDIRAATESYQSADRMLNQYTNRLSEIHESTGITTGPGRERER